MRTIHLGDLQQSVLEVDVLGRLDVYGDEPDDEDEASFTRGAILLRERYDTARARLNLPDDRASLLAISATLTYVANDLDDEANDRSRNPEDRAMSRSLRRSVQALGDRVSDRLRLVW